MQVVKYVFQPHGDDRGQLIALEEFNDSKRSIVSTFKISIYL